MNRSPKFGVNFCIYTTTIVTGSHRVQRVSRYTITLVFCITNSSFDLVTVGTYRSQIFSRLFHIRETQTRFFI